MQNSFFHKRIPTLLGLILLGVGFFAINYAVTHSTFFTTKASPTYTPEEIRITNLTDTSFTISYTTKESVLGTLSYGTTPAGGKVALDDRDQQSGTPQPYLIHHITVKNLLPNTTYYYTISSSDKTFLDNDKPFSTKTLNQLSQNPSRQTPIVGTVSDPANSTDNTMVLLVTDGAQTLSTLVKSDGSFVMPLNALRTSNYSSYITFTDKSFLKLLIENPTGKSTVSVLASQINPVPPITLNNSYDFTTSLQNSPSPIASSSADTTSFPSFTATEAGPKQPSISSPDTNAGLNDQQPQFEGTALPNTPVEIEIHSDTPITTTITANKNGSWSYRPETKLAPGEHTITIKTKNSQGLLQTITRSFTVYAEGSQFTEPSVSPVQPTDTPTPTPEVSTPTPTLEPTATPTQIVTPPATPSAVVTGILTQPPKPLEVSPGSSIVLISGILGTLALGIGGVLLFIARGSSL